MELEDINSLPVGDLDSIRVALNLIERVKDNGGLRNGHPDCEDMSLVEYFFFYALRPYYDCMWGGMDTKALTVMYNLAKLVPEEQAKTFRVYPQGSTGWVTLSEFIEEVDRNCKSELLLELPKVLKESFMTIL